MSRRVVLVATFLVLAPVTASRLLAQWETGISVGSKAPVISVNDLEGRPVDLGAYIGKKPVLLEFWATWCALCEKLLPQVTRVREKYGDQVVMIGINVTVNDSKPRVKRYLAAHRPPFIPLYDDKGASSRAYEVPSTSFVVVVNAAGVVVYTGSGGDQDLVAAVGKAFGGSSGTK